MRSVPEWIADHDDQEIPKRVKLRIFEAAGGRCALSGVKVKPGHYDFDHITPLKDEGEHRETNLQLVCRDRHREKTADEARERTKTTRIKLKHNGLWKTPHTGKLKGRGFKQAEGRRASKEDHQQ